jgi:hypothetical protein
VKETEVNLEDEGFEEITGDEKKPQDAKPGTGDWKGSSGTGGAPGAPAGGGNRPDFRVVQTDRDKEGKSVYVNVGGMWKNISKNGNEFYTLKIGQLKLLVFPNTSKLEQKATEQ